MVFRTTFFFGLLFAALVVGFFILQPYATGLILAITLAVVLRPVYRYLLKFVPNKIISALIVTILTMLLIAGPLAAIVSQIIIQAGEFYNNLAQGAWTSVRLPLGSLVEKFPALASFQNTGSAFGEYLQSGAGWLIGNFGDLFSGLASFGINTLVGLFALYYLLKDGAQFKKNILELSPFSEQETKNIYTKLALSIKSVWAGTLLIALVQGLLAGVGFWIFGLPQPALWGTLTIITALVPVVGTALIWLPASIYLFSTGATGMALGLFLWGAILVGSIDNFLRPKLIERYMKVHPFFILVSVLGGLSLFGPLGFLLGPLVLSLILALLEIYPEFLKS
jgi:predicted PurR-regulated permease PerM